MNGEPQINAIHCLIVRDKDGTEGVPAFRAGGPIEAEYGTMPDALMPAYFIAPRMLPMARELARAFVKQTGMSIKLVKFSMREEIEEFKP